MDRIELGEFVSGNSDSFSEIQIQQIHFYKAEMLKTLPKKIEN
jgi:hypothetical protein